MPLCGIVDFDKVFSECRNKSNTEKYVFCGNVSLLKTVTKCAETSSLWPIRSIPQFPWHEISFKYM